MAKKKILLIDDDVNITKFIKFALERSGRYEVLCESRGQNALSAAKGFNPDLVLLDINLPDVPGGEVAAAFDADTAFRKVPIVFLTGMVSQEEMQSGTMISGRAAIAKPIQVEKLIECIEKNTTP